MSSPSPPNSQKTSQDVSQHSEAKQAALPAQPEYPSTKKGMLIMSAVYLAIFLITLDQNIISTAIPRITDEFHSLNDIGWYGSSYLLTMCCFQLLMGKIYKYYPAKLLFILGITLFEIGSAICGAAPSSTVFIIGRAIAGIGSSGLFSGAMVIMFHTIPLQLRPVYQGLGGGVFAIASVVGPLIGGTFTDKVTWRWCFYINLPVGAVAIIVVMFILHLPNQKLDTPAAGWFAKIKQLDPIGNLFLLPGIICLILGLQWGGTQYAWKDARVIVLLVLCGLFCVAFVVIQIFKGESATVPPRLVKQRSITAAMWFGLFSNSSMMIMLYYLPIWLQAIKGVSAIKSGIMLLPMILSTTVGSISSGILVSKLGYYNPFFILSTVMMTVGAGLLSTFTPNTGNGELIGYQILFGLGTGFGLQQPMNVVQTVLGKSDIATGAAVVMFMRFLGSAVFLPVAQNVFLTRLISTLSNIPDVSSSTIIDGGATELRNLATGNDLRILLSDYNKAIIDTFYMVVATSAMTIIGSLLVEWRSLKARAAEQSGNNSKANPSEETKESV